MQRVRVVGNSGSGKTHLAQRLSAVLELPWLELDSVHHAPGWQEVPVEEFQAAVRAFRDRSEREAGGWVIEGNYAERLGDLLSHADTFVWLDYPRWFVLARLLRRTLTRVIRRTPLWHENYERLGEIFSADPERSIVAWSWTRHGSYRRRYEQLSQQRADLQWVRLRSPLATRRWFAALSGDRG